MSDALDAATAERVIGETWDRYNEAYKGGKLTAEDRAEFVSEQMRAAGHTVPEPEPEPAPAAADPPYVFGSGDPTPAQMERLSIGEYEALRAAMPGVEDRVKARAAYERESAKSAAERAKQAERDEFDRQVSEDPTFAAQVMRSRALKELNTSAGRTLSEWELVELVDRASPSATDLEEMDPWLREHILDVLSRVELDPRRPNHIGGKAFKTRPADKLYRIRAPRN